MKRALSTFFCGFSAIQIELSVLTIKKSKKKKEPKRFDKFFFYNCMIKNIEVKNVSSCNYASDINFKN